MAQVNEAFARFARSVADQCGRAYTFVAVLVAILIWLVSGPLFGFSDTWQLVINTITTLITTLMVFVLQHTQNRDTIAMHAKLDALIRVSEAPNRMQAIEELTEDQLRAVRERERRGVPEVTEETVRAAADQIARRLLAANEDAAQAKEQYRKALHDNDIVAAENFAADLAFAEGTASACTIAIIAIKQATGVGPTVLGRDYS